MESKKFKLEVLISCMHEADMSLARKTNISSDAVIINQCDKNGYEETVMNGHKVRMFFSTERGLSRSRNQALAEARADVCLVCDNDECLAEDHAPNILGAYEANPAADVIAFRLHCDYKTFWNQPRKVGYLDALKLSSWQITFKRDAVVSKGIRFNESFGAGTAVNYGEENIFLYDCLRKGLKIYYVPVIIGSVAQGGSTWFEGFNEKYFFNRGRVTSHYMGVFLATLYALYFSIAKYRRYRKDTRFIKAVSNMLKGIYGKRTA